MDPMGRKTLQTMGCEVTLGASGYLGCEVRITLPWMLEAAIFERCSAPNPRCSMWPIYLQNWVVLGVNVGEYTIH